MGQDLGLIIAIVAGSVTIIAAMLAMFLWLRSEANSDRRHFQDIQRDDRKDLMQISRNLELAVNAIQAEMKEFHLKLAKQDADFKAGMKNQDADFKIKLLALEDRIKA